MTEFPIYVDSLTNVWHHELSPQNTFNDIDSIELLEQDYFDEFEEAATFHF
jgi:hypothetical protein